MMKVINRGAMSMKCSALVEGAFIENVDPFTMVGGPNDFAKRQPIFWHSALWRHSAFTKICIGLSTTYFQNHSFIEADEEIMLVETSCLHQSTLLSATSLKLLFDDQLQYTVMMARGWQLHIHVPQHRLSTT